MTKQFESFLIFITSVILAIVFSITGFNIIGDGFSNLFINLIFIGVSICSIPLFYIGLDRYLFNKEKYNRNNPAKKDVEVQRNPFVKHISYVVLTLVFMFFQYYSLSFFSIYFDTHVPGSGIFFGLISFGVFILGIFIWPFIFKSQISILKKIILSVFYFFFPQIVPILLYLIYSIHGVIYTRFF